jgi:serine/threonine-protein kinase HipA
VKGTLSDLIAKLPLARDDSQVLNEYVCMQLAGMAGVNVAQCRPVPMHEIGGHPDLVEALGADTRFLAVDRFDRGPGGPVHMEDACQLLTMMPSQKYAGAGQFVRLVQVLNRFSSRGIEDVRQFFIRQAVNTLIGNSDAHLKNFSVLFNNGIMPELSPAYDIVCVAALTGFRGFATNVAIDKLQRLETVEAYTAIATRAGISERIAKAAVKQTVSLAKERWPQALREMEVADAVRIQILDRLGTLALTK